MCNSGAFLGQSNLSHRAPNRIARVCRKKSFVFNEPNSSNGFQITFLPAKRPNWWSGHWAKIPNWIEWRKCDSIRLGSRHRLSIWIETVLRLVVVRHHCRPTDSDCTWLATNVRNAFSIENLRSIHFVLASWSANPFDLANWYDPMQTMRSYLRSGYSCQRPDNGCHCCGVTTTRASHFHRYLWPQLGPESPHARTPSNGSLDFCLAEAVVATESQQRTMWTLDSGPLCPLTIESIPPNTRLELCLCSSVSACIPFVRRCTARQSSMLWYCPCSRCRPMCPAVGMTFWCRVLASPESRRP